MGSDSEGAQSQHVDGDAQENSDGSPTTGSCHVRRWYTGFPPQLSTASIWVRIEFCGAQPWNPVLDDPLLILSLPVSAQRNLGDLWRPLPGRIDTWPLASLQQHPVRTGGRLVQHARYYWLMLPESRLTRRLFGAMLR